MTSCPCLCLCPSPRGLLFFILAALAVTDAFLPPALNVVPHLRGSGSRRAVSISMGGGFGKPASGGGKSTPKKKGKASAKSSPTLNDVKALNVPPKTVVSAPDTANIDVKQVIDSIDDSQDVFWQLIKPLLLSEFKPADISRVLGFVDHATGQMALPADIVEDEWRPHEEIHAFMDGIPASPFRDPSLYPFVKELEDNFDAIQAEFETLLEKESERFQSVTSMNYKSGWKTLVLYYNGHTIDDFPYHLTPVTKGILDKIPVAGRIAGFNRQQPNSGIPLHSDGNNMWLTCQMGIRVPAGEKAWIRVGPETRRWSRGKCLVYDTTFEHETFNGSEEEERVVLHVDFWNFVALSPVELQAMQKVYSLRETYLRAEGLLETGGKL